ncbi:MAG: OmpA family protein [Gemmatimonadaceae bacterium]
MTVTKRIVPVVLVLFSVAALDACRSAPPPPVVPAVDTAGERMAREAALESQRAAAAAAAAAARQRAVDDSIARVRAMEDAARRESEMLRNTVTMVINFDFNRATLRDEARAALDAKLPILLANPNVAIRISGHADERGSSEYNLALGSRRAATAKRYLVERGVAESRIETTSFGEERPVCTDSNEGCWMQNRRDEFEITAGGPMLMRP